MRVEILRIDDCPSWESAKSNLAFALNQLGLEEEIDIVLIRSEKEAIRQGFSGSPMMRVNGMDLFPSAEEDFSLRCRIFRVGQKMLGWPSKEMMVEALNETIAISGQEYQQFAKEGK